MDRKEARERLFNVQGLDLAAVGAEQMMYTVEVKQDTTAGGRIRTAGEKFSASELSRHQFMLLEQRGGETEYMTLIEEPFQVEEEPYVMKPAATHYFHEDGTPVTHEENLARVLESVDAEVQETQVDALNMVDRARAEAILAGVSTIAPEGHASRLMDTEEYRQRFEELNAPRVEEVVARSKEQRQARIAELREVAELGQPKAEVNYTPVEPNAGGNAQKGKYVVTGGATGADRTMLRDMDQRAMGEVSTIGTDELLNGETRPEVGFVTPDPTTLEVQAKEAERGDEKGSKRSKKGE